MIETTFQKQILSKLESMEKRIDYIMEYIEDSKLTAKERQLLKESMQQEREGKLVSHNDLKKKLGL